MAWEQREMVFEERLTKSQIQQMNSMAIQTKTLKALSKLATEDSSDNQQGFVDPGVSVGQQLEDALMKLSETNQRCIMLQTHLDEREKMLEDLSSNAQSQKIQLNSLEHELNEKQLQLAEHTLEKVQGTNKIRHYDQG